MRRTLIASFVAFAVCFVAGCPKGNQDYKAAKTAELTGDYDSAVVAYDKALKSDPRNTSYKLHDIQAHFQAGQFHVEQGEKALKKGALELALAEFQKAEALDPSSEIATQEAQKTLELLAKAQQQEQPKPVGVVPPEDTGLMSAPPELKPLSREPINLKMPNTDPRVIFQTIGQLAGLSVIFDPQFNARPVTADFDNVTLEQALNAVSLESGAFWKPVTNNIIFVAQDSPEERRKFEDEEVQTFYLHNVTTPQELTEVVTLIRQLLDVPRVMQVADDNAIVMRATPDKLILANKIIDSIDKMKPEVVVQVDVLETRFDHERTLGIQPGESASLTFTGVPGTTSTTTTGTTTTTPTTPTLPLNGHLTAGDYSLSLPGATLNALLSDSTTHILQDPTVRIEDGSTTKLAIGDKVPIAVSALTPTVGIGAATTSGLGIGGIGTTSFNYQDVGVNLEITPHIHPDGEVSLKMSVDVSSVTSQTNIGGIQQPIISQRKDEGEFTLRDGETSLLGGLITRSEAKTIGGWPGLAKIPFFRYFFSSENVTTEDDDVLIAITPHVVRMPSITPDDLRTLASGTESNVQVYPKGMDGLNPQPQDAAPPAVNTPAKPQANPESAQNAALQFTPSTISMKAGDTMTIGIAVNNVHDLFSIPLLLQYNPAVIQVEDVRNGGFLSGGTQNIAIVHQENAQQGQTVISATRTPNTPGISGSGTLFGIVIKAIAPGTSQLQIVQVNARDPQQKPIVITSGTASVQVQ